MVSAIKIILIVLGLSWLMLKTLNTIGASRRYKKGRAFEEEGDYKSACYQYALAIVEGSFKKDDSSRRIKVLWSWHGPFSYEDKKRSLEEELKKIASGIQQDPSGCDKAAISASLAECLDAIEVIEQVLAGKRKVSLPRTREFGGPR
jgi:hypothetical protein